MVRDPAQRGKKYDDSLDPDSIRARFESQKDAMSEQQKAYFAQIALIEEKTKKIVEEAGVPTIEVAQYINVARKCYSIAKKFSGQTRTDEAQNVLNHWASRGLNGLLLARVCNLSGCGCSAGVPSGTPSACAVGSVLICGPDGWQALTPGEACQYLHSRGPDLIPEWAGPPRVPRNIFAHAHSNDQETFYYPDPCFNADIMFLVLPDNWNGTDRLYVWFLVGENWVNAPFNFTLDAGTHGEAPNTHTQTVNNKLLNASNGTYLRVDLTIDLATVIALLKPGDMLRMTTADTWGMAGYCIGLEVQET